MRKILFMVCILLVAGCSKERDLLLGLWNYAGAESIDSATGIRHDAVMQIKSWEFLEGGIVYVDGLRKTYKRQDNILIVDGNPYDLEVLTTTTLRVRSRTTRYDIRLIFRK